MDWQRHYDMLIGRARERAIEGYSELHHVVPRCLGGDNNPSNLVRLTPEEHFVAHQLLVKLHPGVRPLIFAAHAMMMCGRTKGRSLNKEFGWLRRLNARALGDRRRGVRHTAEARAKMSASKRGRQMSDANKAGIAMALKGKVKSPEHLAKVAAALTGKPGTRRGAVLSEETKQKMKEAALRRYYPDGNVPPPRLTNPKRSARAYKAWATKRSRSAEQPAMEKSHV